MRASGAGGANALLSVGGKRGALVDGDADASWTVFSGDGAAGAGICRGLSALVAEKDAGSAPAHARIENGDKLAARGVAVPMEDCHQLAVRLLHLPVVHPGSVCISRTGGSGKDGPLNERRLATERHDAGLD